MNSSQWPHLAGSSARNRATSAATAASMAAGSVVPERTDGMGDLAAGLEGDHAVGRRELVVVLGRVQLAEDAGLRHVPSAFVMSPKVNVPSVVQSAIRPMSMPKSPTRLTMNALLAAVLALCRSM